MCSPMSIWHHQMKGLPWAILRGNNAQVFTLQWKRYHLAPAPGGLPLSHSLCLD
jgi:hypothetical protein